MDAKEQAKLIKQFVKENYGESEADNPSWDIISLAEYLTEKQMESNMIIITYWHDEDDETISSITCNTDEECKGICEVLKKYKMDIISVDAVPNPSTPKEIEEWLKEVYAE